MIEMQYSFVSLILWFVSTLVSFEHAEGRPKEPLSPSVCFLLFASIETMTVGGLWETILKYDIGASYGSSGGAC